MPLSGGGGGRTAAVVPGYSSVRLQKAYRLNGVEGIRLQWRLQILDRQKVRAVRLVNQDIRLTRIALEHIHISSGVSVDVDDIDDDVGDRRNGGHVDGPMFLYGERQVSRKQGRGRRVQSAAAGEAASRRSAPTDDHVDAATKRPLTALPAAAEAMVFDVVRARAAAHFSVAPPAPLAAPVDSRAAVALSRGQPLPTPPPPPSGIARTNLGNFYSLTPLALGRAVTSSTAVDGRAQAAGGETAGVSKPAAARATAVSADSASRPKNPAVSGGPRPSTTSEAYSTVAAAAPAVASLTKAAATAKTATMEARATGAATAARASITAAASEKKPSPPAAAAAAAASSAGAVDAALARNDAAATTAQPPPVAVASRAQRTAEAVQKARAQSGRAKRFRNSVVGDPLLDQTLPMAEKKRKQKEAALQHRKNAQRTADESVAEKVRDYLVKHPLLDGGRKDAGGGDDDLDGDDDVFEEAAAVQKETAVGAIAGLRRSRSLAWAS